MTAPRSIPVPSQRLYRVLLFSLVLLAAFALRIWRLGAAEFWFDELASTFVADRPLPDVLHYVTSAVGEHPPLYYLLLNLWQRLVGQSEFAQRSLALGFGTLFVALMARLGQRVGGTRMAALALVVAIIQPFAVAHSRENRMYSLLLLLTALALIFTLDLMQRRRRALLHLVAVCLLGMMTSYFFAPLLLGIMLLLLWKGRLPRRTVALAVGGVGSLLVGALLWLQLYPGPARTIQRVLDTPRSLQLYLTGSYNGLIHISGATDLDAPWGILIPAIVWGLALLGLLVMPRRLPLWPFVLAEIPLFLLLPWIDGRYLSAIVPVLVIATAAALLWLTRQQRLLAASAALLLLAANSVGLGNLARQQPGFFGAALTSVQATFDPQRDLFILSEPDSWVAISYYGKRLTDADPFPVQYFPSDNVPVLTEGEIENRLPLLMEQYDRLLLGPIQGRNRDPDSLLERYLVTHAFPAARTFWPDGTLLAPFVSPRPLAPGPSDLQFLGQARLVGSQLSALEVPAGDALLARLRWLPLQSALPALVVSLALEDDQGQVWATQATEPCNGWCSSRDWQAGSEITDNRALLLPSDLPPGLYRLVLRVVDPTSAADEAHVLSTVTILDQAIRQGPENPLRQLTDSIGLVGAELSHPDEMHAGEEIGWSARWSLNAAGSDGWLARWELVDEADQVQQRWELPPSRADYPPTRWPPGRVVRGQGRLLLDGALPPGHYQVRLTAATGDGQTLADPVLLGAVTIVDRERTFELPDIGTRVTDALWEQGVRLYASTLPERASAGNTIQLTLIWQASGPTERSYKVTVQLRAAANVIVAQDDDFPAAGSAPSNSWADGEVIVEQHPLTLREDLPPGDYALFVGIYDPISGARLPLAGGNGDEYRLGTVRITAP